MDQWRCCRKKSGKQHLLWTLQGVPRIISDVQLVPPRTTTSRDTANLDWADDASDPEPWPEELPVGRRSRLDLKSPLRVRRSLLL